MLSCIALKVDWTGNPPQPISTGNTHALYHLLRLQDLVLWFVSLVGLLASLFQWDNKLYQDDHLALLGPNYNVRRGDDVWKNRSRNPKSACISQKVAESRMGFFPGISWLMSLTDHLLSQGWWIFFCSFFGISASSQNTCSCLRLCMPCVKETLQDDKTCSRVPLFPQSLQLIPSVRPNL